jgi:hypothetical protein
MRICGKPKSVQTPLSVGQICSMLHPTNLLVGVFNPILQRVQRLSLCYKTYKGQYIVSFKIYDPNLCSPNLRKFKIIINNFKRMGQSAYTISIPNGSLPVKIPVPRVIELFFHINIPVETNSGDHNGISSKLVEFRFTLLCLDQ